MLNWAGKYIFRPVIIASGLVLLLTPSLFAQSPSTYQLLSTPFYDPRGTTSNTCLSGSYGSGPLFGPRFPAVSDVGDLANRIRTYIHEANTNSTLDGYANNFVQLGQKYNVNPVLVVAMAQKETSLGTAGYGSPGGGYNITNIRPNGSFARYINYPEGIEASYKNLAGDLYLGPPANFTSVAEIINRWAPPSDNNDTSGYINFVQDVLKKVLSGAAASDTTSADSADTGGAACVSGGGTSAGIVSTDGYAFPVAPQKKSQNGGVPGMSALPCPSSSCHHDGTPAFDISRQPGGDAIVGTPVYAISDGVVGTIHTYTYNGVALEGCYSMEFHSSKDNFWYWYGHIYKPLVKNGDHLKAGQQVASIGWRKCTGNNSDSHLHIDRGCIKDGVPQQGGYEDCRDPGINALINKLYEELPQ